MSVKNGSYVGSFFEFGVPAKVDKYYRIVLPQPICQQVSWISGTQPIDGWLLVRGPGRCRLLSAVEADSDDDLQLLRARITAELNATSTSALEFQDEVSEALVFRLLPLQITPPKPGWRLTLPRLIASVMQIRPGESDVAVLLLHGHIELWMIETLRSAMSPPFSEII